MRISRTAASLLAGLAVCGLPSGAIAAEATIEGAQALFGEVIGLSKAQVGYSIGSFPNKNDNRPSPDYGNLFAYWTIDRAEIVKRCVTRFHLVPNSVRVSDDRNNINVKPLISYDVDWGKVSNVDTSKYFMGNDLPGWQLKIVLGGQEVWLAFDTSEKNHTRLGNASKFLKERCVASTDTGF